MGHHGRQGGFCPEIGRLRLQMIYDHRGNPHQRSIARRFRPASVPRLAQLLLKGEKAHRGTDAEYRPGGESFGHFLGYESAILDHLLQGPEGKLGVVRRKARGLIMSTAIGQVIPDFPVQFPPPVGQHPLRGIPEGIADGQAQHHALNTIEIEAGPEGEFRGIEQSASFQVDTTSLK